MELTNTLSNIQNSLSLFIPELGIICSIILLLLVDLFLKKEHRGTYKYFALALLIMVFLLTQSQFSTQILDSYLFEGKLHLIRDGVVLKSLFQLGAIGVVLFSVFDKNQFKKYEARVEYYVLLLGILLGCLLYTSPSPRDA